MTIPEGVYVWFVDEDRHTKFQKRIQIGRVCTLKEKGGKAGAPDESTLTSSIGLTQIWVELLEKQERPSGACGAEHLDCFKPPIIKHRFSRRLIHVEKLHPVRVIEFVADKSSKLKESRQTTVCTCQLPLNQNACLIMFMYLDYMNPSFLSHPQAPSSQMEFLIEMNTLGQNIMWKARLG
jgi:hypothetical protein